MFGTKNITLSEKIVLLLKDKKLSAKSLLVKINSKEKSYSIQALYDQLRILVHNEVLLKEKNHYLINNDWIVSIKHLFEPKDELIIEKNQKNIYTCSTLHEIDKLWKNLFYSLSEKQNVFIYNPEPFWHLLKERSESEKRFYTEQAKQNIQTYCVIGGNIEHYQKYKKGFSSKSFYIEGKRLDSIKDNLHITIFGEYLLYTKIHIDINSKIQKLFNRNISRNNLVQEINIIANQKTKHKLVIEHNPKKALIYKKRIARVFFSEKQTREMFEKNTKN